MTISNSFYARPITLDAITTAANNVVKIVYAILASLVMAGSPFRRGIDFVDLLYDVRIARALRFRKKDCLNAL